MVETYDTTTIRASTPMFLMARKIKAMGVKMVLSGEGADEVRQVIIRPAALGRPHIALRASSQETAYFAVMARLIHVVH